MSQKHSIGVLKGKRLSIRSAPAVQFAAIQHEFADRSVDRPDRRVAGRKGGTNPGLSCRAFFGQLDQLDQTADFWLGLGCHYTIEIVFRQVIL
jgi:hypothetical protein